MAEQLDLGTFTGPHPTNREFVAQLEAWGFTQRRVEDVHLVFRGPGGGTLRVVRSLLGRADAAMVTKAARLAGVDVARFWAGPRRAPASRDRITSTVLAAHTSEDRPLGFDQVVRLCGGRVTREQVRNASSQLCREGQLDRIRSGVYQWSEGVRAQRQQVDQAQSSSPTRATTATPRPAPMDAHPVAAEMFDQLFPHGVRMTAEVFAEYEQWAQLTEKLAKYAVAS